MGRRLAGRPKIICNLPNTKHLESSRCPANMPSDPTFTYPPLHHHTSTPLDPKLASAPLASYLEKSLTRPYLHPDAWLSLEGVRHGPKSGPQGSWALHHLRRIEAGMRGESLAVESTEELVERFGEEIVGEAMGRRGSERKEEKVSVNGKGEENVEQNTPAKARISKPEHLMTKAEKKKARRAAEKAEIARARERGEAVPTFGKKRKRGSEVAGSESTPPTTSHRAADINDPSQYTSAQRHAESQKEEVADVGDRDPAGVDREDAVKAPVVVEHDEQGDVVVPSKKRKGEAGEQDKEARRAAKKARKAEEKNRKSSKEGTGDVKMEDADPASPAPAAAGNLTRKERRKLKEGGQMNGTPDERNGDVKTEKKDPIATSQTNGTPVAGKDKKSAKKKAKRVKAEKAA